MEGTRYLAALRILLYNTSILATAFFSLIQNLAWTSVLHALEHWSDGFCKWNFSLCVFLHLAVQWAQVTGLGQLPLLGCNVTICPFVTFSQDCSPGVPATGTSFSRYLVAYTPQGPVFCSLVPAHVSDGDSASLERGVIYLYLENTCWLHDMVHGMRCGFVSKQAYVDRFYVLIYKFL